MRIVLDARKYFDFGIGTYIQNLIPYVGSHSDLVLLLATNDADRITLPSSIQKIINLLENIHFVSFDQIARDANRMKADVFHSPHYTTPFGLKMPCVTTIHDIVHVRGREYFPYPKRIYARTMISHAYRSSAAIIVDSEFTKQELLDLFPVHEAPVHVIHLGVSSMYSAKYSEISIQEFRNKYHLTKPTILYTGSLKPHKNVGVLIRAFAHMNSDQTYNWLFPANRLHRKKIFGN